jgi:hypothetical protein
MRTQIQRKRLFITAPHPLFWRMRPKIQRRLRKTRNRKKLRKRKKHWLLQPDSLVAAA